MSDLGREEAALLFEIVRRRYGERLGPEELEEVRRGVERIVEMSMELRSVELRNWDEPPLTFRPYRGEDEEDAS
jgi:TATA-binding protein-associated factor Taf7